MASNTWSYGVTAFCAAFVAAAQRYGNAPIAAVQGTSAPAAGMTLAAPLTATHVARKADDRFRPRGRRR